MEAEIKELKEQVAKLEKSRKSSFFKIFMQYLFSPILIIIIVILAIFEIDKYKSEIEKLKKSQVIPSNNKLESEEILKEILKDENFKVEIENIIDKYMDKKIAKLKESENKVVNKQNINENKNLKIAFKDEISINIPNSYKIAEISEKEAFSALIKGEYNLAIQKFKKAYIAYPTYHSVDEIYNLLLKNQSELKLKSVKNMVFQKIIDDYYWKIPKETLNELKNQIK